MKIKRSELIQLANKYIGNDSLEAQNQVMLKIATARCARISYETLGDNPKVDYEADIRLHDRLLAEGHMSPMEHIARAMDNEEYYSFRNGKLSINNKGVLYDDESDKNTFGWCRNYRGWISYRSLI